MVQNDTRFLEAAITLAEVLNFGRAARKLGMSQPILTKIIQDLEHLVGGPLFIRDTKHCDLNDAGRAYIEQARLSLMYGDRAIQAARSVMRDADTAFHVGRSPYVDPFWVSTMLSIKLPLFPRLKLELISQFSVDLIHDLLAGELDLAIANEPPESPLLTRVKIAESPFYIAMAKRDQLAHNSSITLEHLNGRRWILFERRLHPPLYDSIFQAASRNGVTPVSVQHVTMPEEAFPFVSDGVAIALVVKAGALRIARNGVTVRPLNEPGLRMSTYLVSRADDNSKIASELVRTFMRKATDVKQTLQLRLPIFP